MLADDDRLFPPYFFGRRSEKNVALHLFPPPIMASTNVVPSLILPMSYVVYVLIPRYHIIVFPTLFRRL
jgi:hypothetical protein